MCRLKVKIWKRGLKEETIFYGCMLLVFIRYTSKWEGKGTLVNLVKKDREEKRRNKSLLSCLYRVWFNCSFQTVAWNETLWKYLKITFFCFILIIYIYLKQKTLSNPEREISVNQVLKRKYDKIRQLYLSYFSKVKTSRSEITCK